MRQHGAAPGPVLTFGRFVLACFFGRYILSDADVSTTYTVQGLPLENTDSQYSKDEPVITAHHSEVDKVDLTKMSSSVLRCLAYSSACQRGYLHSSVFSVLSCYI
jgi:hypothetical protein